MSPFKAICAVCKWIAFMLCFYPKCSTSYLSFIRCIFDNKPLEVCCHMHHVTLAINFGVSAQTFPSALQQLWMLNIEHRLPILKVIRFNISFSSTLLMCSPQCHILGNSLLPFSLKLYWVIKWSFRRSLIMFWLVYGNKCTLLFIICIPYSPWLRQ